MQPVFAYLVDIRHNTLYANVYAISDMAVCLGAALGKFLFMPICLKFYDILWQILSVRQLWTFSKIPYDCSFSVRYVCPSPLGPLVGGPIEFEFGFTW